MADTSENGARLLALGTRVKLRDGEWHRLVYDYEALEALEEHFGSLEVFVQKLMSTDRLQSKWLQNVRFILAAGLVHERLPEQTFEEFHEALRAQMDPRETLTYIDAMRMAVVEAFPEPAEEPPDPKAKGRNRSASPGNSSTTSPRSNTTEATRSSGA